MGRHLDERLALRSPLLFRRLLKLALSLSPGSPLRRGVLNRLAARGWEALSREDDEIVLLVFERAVEFNVIGDDFGALGVASCYRGHEGWLEFIARWRVSWVLLDHTPEEMIDLGDRLVTRVSLTAPGATSGADVAQMRGAVDWFAHGALVWHENYCGWTECVQALGLDNATTAVSR